MHELMANVSLGFNSLGPMDDERVGAATAMDFTLPAFERRIAGPGPTPSIVVVGLDAAELVQELEVKLQVVRNHVEKQMLVDRAMHAPFWASAVVGDDENQRVVELAGLLEIAN